jgi:hypothetical protein
LHKGAQLRQQAGGLSAKSPKFHRFCLQTAVNHENAAAVGFGGKIGYRY